MTTSKTSSTDRPADQRPPRPVVVGNHGSPPTLGVAGRPLDRNPPALLRLAGAVLVEAHDEWQVSDRRYLSEASMATLTTTTPGEGVVAQPSSSRHSQHHR